MAVNTLASVVVWRDQTENACVSVGIDYRVSVVFSCINKDCIRLRRALYREMAVREYQAVPSDAS